MTRILLIRHAATDVMNNMLCGRTPGISLSASGRRQAEAVAKRLESFNVKAIYSSPLERALETAELLARHHNVPVQIEDGFQELDFGEWTGKTFEELASDPSWFKFNQVRSSVTPPGGESPVIVVERARRALNSAAARHDADLVAIVTHADVIRSLLTSLLGMPLDHLLRFEIEPASVTELWMGGDYPIIRSLSTLYAVEL